MKRLFLLEDEFLLNKAISNYLVQHDFEVSSFYDGENAYDALHKDFDLYILDIDVPQISGSEILEAIRRVDSHTPVIMISALTHINSIANAYDLGCTDYLKKPFDIQELTIKIQKLLPDNMEINLSKGLIYHEAEAKLTFEAVPIRLTRKEELLFSFLIQRRTLVVTYEMIDELLWDYEGDISRVRKLVNRLRTKLPIEVINNINGIGYKIV